MFKPELKRVMAAHGINNQQDIHQRLLKNLIDADFETQATMLRCVTTPFVVTEEVSRIIRAAGMKSLADDPPEPEDQVFEPQLS